MADCCPHELQEMSWSIFRRLTATSPHPEGHHRCSSPDHRTQPTNLTTNFQFCRYGFTGRLRPQIRLIRTGRGRTRRGMEEKNLKEERGETHPGRNFHHGRPHIRRRYHLFNAALINRPMMAVNS